MAAMDALGIPALEGGRRAGWWWFGVASRPRGRNGAAAGEHGPGLGRPMTVTLVGVITLMKASSRAVSLSVPNAPGETLDPVPPGLAMATLCVVLPLEGIALELVRLEGRVALAVVGLLFLLSSRRCLSVVMMLELVRGAGFPPLTTVNGSGQGR